MCRLDPNFTTVPDTPTTPSGMILRLQRNTAEALRLCGEEIDRRGLFPPLSTAVLLLTAGLSQNGENAPGPGTWGDTRKDHGEMMKTHLGDMEYSVECF